MSKNYTLNLKAIPQISKNIAGKLKGGEVLGLIGPLGSGKTTFTQALAKQLKVKHRVTSPTFIIMNIFPAVLPHNKKRVSLLHLDLYRTRGIREIDALGLSQIWGRPDTVTVIEWANKIKKFLPEKTWLLNFNEG
jgi:tRNA threonylcarbamoyladenosine biosynthesis protein TsaE